MTAADQEGRRLVLTQAATSLAHEAVEAAGASDPGSAEWHFFHGVEAAAQHVLRPEMAMVREGTTWLDAEEPSFKDGFVQAASALALATSADMRPMRIRMPEPPATRRRGR